MGSGSGADRPVELRSIQADHNRSEWATGRYVDLYANRVLTPAEVQIFIRYHEQLSGRVLDVGCGAGRVLAYLVMIGADAYGIDLAEAMVEYCRRTIPEANVRQGDVQAIGDDPDAPFDVVIAPDSLIDVFDDPERRKVIADVRHVLAPGGLFIFSTHDLAWLDANSGPKEWEQTSTAGTARKFLDRSLAEMFRAVRNRREIARNRARLGPLQQRHETYAIVNDFPHNYSLLHHYIRRDDQERQLNELGYELVECLAASGRVVGPGEMGDSDSSYYIARRT